MRNRPEIYLRSTLCCAILFAPASVAASALECPSPGDQIVTDRPDVTDSSLVVPHWISTLASGSTAAPSNYFGYSIHLDQAVG
jgi:hypothetical protein